MDLLCTCTFLCFCISSKTFLFSLSRKSPTPTWFGSIPCQLFSITDLWRYLRYITPDFKCKNASVGDFHCTNISSRQWQNLHAQEYYWKRRKIPKKKNLITAKNVEAIMKNGKSMRSSHHPGR